MLSLDNWDYNMKYTMVYCGPVLVGIFSVISTIIGVFLVLNLFLAVLLGNLDQLELEEGEKEEKGENEGEGGELLPVTEEGIQRYAECSHCLLSMR